MTSVLIDGQTYDVEISATIHIGYTAVDDNFSDVNGLPKYKVTAAVNGQNITQTVTFAAHNIIPTSVLGDENSKVLLNAIGFDAKNFAQNGVGLPNFAPRSSSTNELLALSAQFGAFPIGGPSYNMNIGSTVKVLADRYNDLLDNGTDQEIDSFLSNAKATVNGMVVKIRTDLLRPVNQWSSKW